MLPGMLELDDAVAHILAAVPPAQNESVSLDQAARRVLLETILAPIDLPTFDNSAMDGYAVRAADLESARADAPVPLQVVGRVAAGEQFAAPLASGCCVRIFTGSPLPSGADAVLMQEDTRPDSNSPNRILSLDRVKPRENIRFRGEDVKAGKTLAESGTVLHAALLALLSATGLVQVQVGRRPVVSLLATGSELQEPGTALAPGRIYESNRLMLAELVRSAGGGPQVLPLVKDELSATKAALERAFGACDVLVTSGGVSVGELDFVKQAFQACGGRLQFWKVAIKPGRPFLFGRWGEKFLFGLPGNPISALVTFVLLVRPALLRWQGAASVGLPAHGGILGEPLRNDGSRRHFVRVRIDSQGQVYSTGIQASHVLSSMACADGLVDVPPQTTFEAGKLVQVLTLWA